MLYQSTHSAVAVSTSVRVVKPSGLNGDPVRTHSVLYRPMMVSVRALRPLCQAAHMRPSSVRSAARMMAKVSRAM